MTQKHRVLILFLTLLIALSFAVVLVTAAAGNPQTLFTDNTASTGSTTAVTVMEQELLDRINGATTSIDAAFYDFNRVSIRDALIAAKNRGVVVRVVADDEAYANTEYIPHFTALETAGITVINDGRSSIMHNKFAVIDDEIVWTGSTNWTDNGFTYNHNNSLVFTSTQMADIYTVEFNEMFVDTRFGTAKTDNTTHTLTYNGIPLEIYFSPTDNALNELIAEVNVATETIQFSIFFFTDDALRDAIISRIQAGVKVTGIWDNLGAANQYSDDEALCLAGAAIKTEDFGGKMHHKFMVIDANGTNPVVVTGSMNWSGSGADANDENTIIIHDGATAQAYLTAFQVMYDALDLDTLCNPNRVYLPLVVSNAGSTPPPAADVQLMTIVYDPPGTDVDGEYVSIQNSGGEAQDLTGWTLSDEAATTYTFPAFTLQAGATVNVWVKTGIDGTTDLFWGRGSSVWNNTGDTAFLRDSSGTDIDTCAYVGGGTSTSCNN